MRRNAFRLLRHMQAGEHVGWVECSDTQQSKPTSPGVARQQVTFLVLPRKVTQRRRPRFAAASRFPALLDWSGGCGTRTSCSDSPRRLPLTSLRYSAAHRGRKIQNQKSRWVSHCSIHLMPAIRKPWSIPDYSTSDLDRVGCNKRSALHRMKTHTAQCATLIDALRLTRVQTVLADCP